jgi:4-hydroxy-3-polyprenylbenzoate decarboxylase
MFRNDVLSKVLAIFVLDFGDTINDLSLALWFIAGNMDPQRDMHFFTIEGDSRTRIGFDGTRKAYKSDNFRRDWPNVVMMDKDTISKVDSIWNDLNLGNFMPSPSLSLQSLQVGDDPVVRFGF